MSSLMIIPLWYLVCSRASFSLRTKSSWEAKGNISRLNSSLVPASLSVTAGEDSPNGDEAAPEGRDGEDPKVTCACDCCWSKSDCWARYRLARVSSNWIWNCNQMKTKIDYICMYSLRLKKSCARRCNWYPFIEEFCSQHFLVMRASLGSFHLSDTVTQKTALTTRQNVTWTKRVSVSYSLLTVRFFVISSARDKSDILPEQMFQSSCTRKDTIFSDMVHGNDFDWEQRYNDFNNQLWFDLQGEKKNQGLWTPFLLVIQLVNQLTFGLVHFEISYSELLCCIGIEMQGPRTWVGYI